MASTIGEPVKKKRLALGITQAALSLKNGVKQETISGIERGGRSRDPRMTSMMALLPALEMTQGDLSAASGYVELVQEGNENLRALFLVARDLSPMRLAHGRAKVEWLATKRDEDFQYPGQ